MNANATLERCVGRRLEGFRSQSIHEGSRGWMRMTTKIGSSVQFGLQQVLRLAFALSMTVTMSALAQTECTVRALPADAESSWQRAAREARGQAESLPATQRDCREITLRVERGQGALVAITTVDGRTAVRQAAGP